LVFEHFRLGQPSGKLHPPPVIDTPSTTVIITFLDEPVPYRTKIPAAPVTLKHFKEFLPKKGNYRYDVNMTRSFTTTLMFERFFRYFFKTKCEELENTPIQEEIFNDSDHLPLWEGKIMAKVKNVE
jgi:axin 1